MNSNFFESIDKESIQTVSSSIWTKYDPAMDLGRPLFAGFLLKTSKSSTAELDSRYFILQENYLIYKQTEESSNISSALKIKYAQVKFPTPEEMAASHSKSPGGKFAIKICSRGKYSVLFARNEEEFQLWMTQLSRVMLRVDFHSKYQVTKAIGQGAFANVYEAVSREDSQQKFAVKGFNKAVLEAQPREKQSLWNEITILRQLDHPNLLRLHEVHETQNSLYLVTEVVAGGELTQFLDQGKTLNHEELRNIAIGLARGINSLASKQIVHRDLKPNNVMLRKTSNITDQDVVIVDFGLATYTHCKNFIFKRCGTPGYIAPEIISSANPEHDFKVTTSCDVFGLGSIVYSLVHGCSPFHAPDRPVADVLRANLECQVSFGVAGFGWYTVDLVAVLSQILRPDPKDRLTIFQVLRSHLFEKFSQSSPKSKVLANSPHRHTYSSLLHPYQILPARGPLKISLEEYMSPEMFAANTPPSPKRGSFPSPLQNTVNPAKSTVFRQSAYSSQKVSASKDKTEIGPFWDKPQSSFGKQEKERPVLALQSSPQQKNRLSRLYDARPEELNLPFLRGHRKTMSSVNK